jgi:hypothetical protein
MPYPNEHAARIKAPSGFTKFRREKNKLGQGIDVIYGIDSDGKSVVQAIRFSKSKFTVEQAKKWLKDHDYDPLEFEAASGNDRADGVERQVRWDRATIRKATRTPEGFLKADATVTRTGVFEYRNADGSLRKELRHPDDVMDGVSLDSMKMIPVTNGHPPERIVTSETARYYQVGATGENIRPDGQFVVSPLVITDGDAIAEIERGRSQVSLGYEVDLLPERGKFRGDDYDFRQTNIRYNHLALVDEARAGDEAIIHLDSADAMSEGIIERQTEPQSQEEHMGKFNIDGIPYEAAQEVINHVGKETARADAAEKELAETKKALATAEGERDAHKDELDKLKKADNSDAVQTAVKARRELERKAEKVLKGDGEVKVDELSDRDLMVATVKKVHADADMAEKSDEYVQARFDAVVEAAGTSDGAAADTRAKAGGDQMVHSDTKGEPVEDARKRMIERMTKKDQKGGDGK